MLQSNALTVPLFIAVASTSICLSQPVTTFYQAPSVLEEDMYRTTTVGQNTGMYFNPKNTQNMREQALNLFGQQSNLSPDERQISINSLRKISTSVGLNIFDMYKKRNNI